MIKHDSPATVTIFAVIGISIVGFFDYVSGTEIRIFPLYFIPLIYAAWYVGKTIAFALSLFTAVLWIFLMYLGGQRYHDSYIWIINFITQGSVFVLISMLVSHLKGLLVREYTLSRKDALTGLLNSRAFYEDANFVLKSCYKNKSPITIVYLDLDNFKFANDTYGHIYGDTILRDVAQVFKQTCRSSDLVARLGGDEFAILLPKTAMEDSRKILDRIQSILTQDPELNKSSITASIGAVSYKEAPNDLKEMIKSADSLMYKVKKNSKNSLLIEMH